MDNQEKHEYCTNKLIELANELKKEDIDPAVVSSGLMTASSIYVTYVAAGNNGALEPSGVDKAVDAYRRILEHFQKVKRSDLEELQAKS